MFYIVDNGCSNKHGLGASGYAGIGAGGLVLCLILVTVIIFLIFYLRVSIVT